MFTPLLIALFLTFTPAQADTAITVSGSVLEVESQTVIVGATLTFTELETVLTTNEEGFFTVEGNLAGTHTVLVEAEGYKSKEMTIEVTESAVLKIELEKAPVEENENDDID